MSNNTDLGEAFETLKSTMYTKYKGCLILNDSVGTYTWGGYAHLTLEGAKDAIDSALAKTGLTINRLK